ncbi:MAG TPA: glucose-6-phosphate isomerase [Firmicutes bacterium]|jgi:glucose-6-phosphate isomerase|nr:glucose-6-phosphate isomerase [Bacillota bacterium]
MTQLRLNYQYAADFVAEAELEYLAPSINLAHEQLHGRSGPGSEFLGWLDLPVKYNEDEMDKVKEAARRIQETSDVLIVIGIGGSYLGAKAAIEALTHSFYNMLDANTRKTPRVLFVGHAISDVYLQDLIELVQDQDFSVNVISKSGTTTEPAIAFRVFKELLEKKYGVEGAKSRIYATTDASRGALKSMATEQGYTSFVIPCDVGGRFSVLTPVGLLPMAVAGIDIDEIMRGAKAAHGWYQSPDLADNAAYQYAALRNILYRKGKNIEVLANYEPSLQYLSEWWKQLYGESEGKDQKGIFPASVNFTTDLHSMGQFMQDGSRNIFATTMWINESRKECVISSSTDDGDGLNYLAGKTLGHVNRQAFLGTILAHTDGGVPNLVLEIPNMNAFYFGSLIYFFEKACAISGYLLGVNPFDQPGVEAYKKNMFALLGKPGFEALREQLQKRLK